MGGLPKLDYTRSLSRYGLSQVTVVSRTAPTSISRASSSTSASSRSRTSCPPASRSRWGRSRPGSARSTCTRSRPSRARRRRTASEYTPTDLRTIQDWIIKPQLRTVPGVIEVNSIGGFERQFHVLPDPGAADGLQARLPRRHDGAGRQQRQCRRRLHRAQRRAISRPHARARSPTSTRSATSSSARAAACRSASATSPRSRKAQELRTGAATVNGKETVLGTAMLLIGENSRTVAQRVAAKLQDIAQIAAGRRDRPRRLRPHASGRSDDRRPSRRTSSRARLWSSPCCS